MRCCSTTATRAPAYAGRSELGAVGNRDAGTLSLSNAFYSVAHWATAQLCEIAPSRAMEEHDPAPCLIRCQSAIGSSCRALSARSDQYFCRDAEPFVQAADHRDR
jgi:hypothetical protein